MGFGFFSFYYKLWPEGFLEDKKKIVSYELLREIIAFSSRKQKEQ